MRSAVMKMFNLEAPIFAFSHCRDVVAAVSRAGGMGVLGTTHITAEQLEIELDWLDEHTGDKSYGVDLMFASNARPEYERITIADLEHMIPQEHRNFVDALMQRYKVPELPDDEREGVFQAYMQGMVRTHKTAEGRLEVVYSHPKAKVIASALGVPPQGVIERCHEHGIKVIGMLGHPKHVARHVDAGAFTGMVYAGVSGNLMSLGAIDFGLIVDGSVVMVENIVRKLSGRKPDDAGPTLATIRTAGSEVARPVFFAVLIIMIVYVPIMVLEGVEGKMFRPMALTVVFALAASLLLSLTFMPVMASFVFRKGVRERETWVIRIVKRFYLPSLRRIAGYPKLTVTVAVSVFLLSGFVASEMGAEFIPRLDEGVARDTSPPPPQRGPQSVHRQHDPDRDHAARSVSRDYEYRIQDRSGRDPHRSNGR